MINILIGVGLGGLLVFTGFACLVAWGKWEVYRIDRWDGQE